jgi:oligopeptide transport system substrate-binding protein
LNAMIETWRDVLEADVTIDFLSAEDFTSAAREEHGHMVSYGWCADYPDPENFLDILYHSESDFNVAGYHNPEVDAMLEQARVELDVSTRLALYQEIERLLLEDGAAITLWHGVSDALVNERIEGFVLAPMGAPVIPLLSINPAESSQGGGE